MNNTSEQRTEKKLDYTFKIELSDQLITLRFFMTIFPKLYHFQTQPPNLFYL